MVSVIRKNGCMLPLSWWAKNNNLSLFLCQTRVLLFFILFVRPCMLYPYTLEYCRKASIFEGKKTPEISVRGGKVTDFFKPSFLRFFYGGSLWKALYFGNTFVEESFLISIGSFVPSNFAHFELKEAFFLCWIICSFSSTLGLLNNIIFSCKWYRCRWTFKKIEEQGWNQLVTNAQKDRYNLVSIPKNCFVTINLQSVVCKILYFSSIQKKGHIKQKYIFPLAH